jgi:hypothetical protein
MRKSMRVTTVFAGTAAMAAGVGPAAAAGFGPAARAAQVSHIQASNNCNNPAIKNWPRCPSRAILLTDASVRPLGLRAKRKLTFCKTVLVALTA